MIYDSKIIEIFYKIDDFMLEYDKIVAQSGISIIKARKKQIENSQCQTAK